MWAVTIQKIDAINPIPNADSIEVADVLGWKVVVKKGEFKSGDLCIYIPIDSIVPPNNPYFDFMKDRGYRVCTIKLRKQLSQGLIVPLSLLKTIYNGELSVGTEVQKELGICKYEKETRIASSGKWYKRLHGKTMPSFIKKTDEERIQNLGWESLSGIDDTWEITEKLNGSSLTVYYDPLKATRYERIVFWIKSYINKFKKVWELQRPELGLCSRNVDLSEDLFKKSKTNLYVQATLNSKLNEAVEKYCFISGRKLAFQGEMIGPGIQGNYYSHPIHTVKLFKIWDIDNQFYLFPQEVTQILTDIKSWLELRLSKFLR